jgi:uncharacterized protein YecA (UPF0149 family)
MPTRYEDEFPEEANILSGVCKKHQIMKNNGKQVKPIFLDVTEPIMSFKIGRNEPCPCGSGKKYKKCCIIKT